MDNIIRSWWVVWDNSDGTEGEELFRGIAAGGYAWRCYDKQVKLGCPFVKLVACYNDHDETVELHKVETA